MKTVATHDAKTNLSRYLQEVSEGATIVIARGRVPLAKLVPFRARAKVRPKVGEVMDRPQHIPEEALRPLTGRELKTWGL
jgi:antitoxin (DNA-binding transcriptional repressor) of toxin-antitoxin stability system